MVETVRYSKIFTEDLALGNGTRNVRLGNAGVYTLHEINLQGFLTAKVVTVPAVAAAAVLTATTLIPAGARVWGVTSKVTTAFGTTNGLASLALGTPTAQDLWGTGLALTLNSQSGQGHFTSSDLPIYASATSVLVSALGGTFDATGAIELALFYTTLAHPS